MPYPHGGVFHSFTCLCQGAVGRPVSRPHRGHRGCGCQGGRAGYDIIGIRMPMLIAILSDIHGNLEALDEVLQDVGIVDAIWCLGDLVGYGPDPAACIGRARDGKFLCIAGNHDLAAAGEMDSSEAFNVEADTAVQWTTQQLNRLDRAFLASLPTEEQHGDFTLVHGSPLDPVWEYLTNVRLAQLNFAYFASRYCLVGHTHVPLVFRQPFPEAPAQAYETIVPQPDEPLHLDERRLIINPGAVGQPRDGHPEAAYMLLDMDAATITLRRVAYPVERVQQKMLRAGLPERLARRLAYGW